MHWNAVQEGALGKGLEEEILDDFNVRGSAAETMAMHGL